MLDAAQKNAQVKQTAAKAVPKKTTKRGRMPALDIPALVGLPTKKGKNTKQHDAAEGVAPMKKKMTTEELARHNTRERKERQLRLTF